MSTTWIIVLAIGCVCLGIAIGIFYLWYKFYLPLDLDYKRAEQHILQCESTITIQNKMISIAGEYMKNRAIKDHDLDAEATMDAFVKARDGK